MYESFWITLALRIPSFAILSIMEFDGLKLDRSLVANIVGNSRSQIVAKAVIDVCRQLGVHVAAAGCGDTGSAECIKRVGM